MSSSPDGAARPRSLLPRMARATFNYGAGAVLPKLVGFLLIPVFTRLLTPADYGVLDLATALGGLLTVVMRFGVPGAVTRFYYDHREGAALRDYVTTTAAFLLLASLVVGGLMLALGPWLLPRTLPGLDYFPYVVLVVAASFLSSSSDLQRRLIQAREQSAYSAKLSTAMATVTLVLAVFFVAGLRWGAAGYLLASAVAAAIFFAQACWYLRRDLTGRFRWPLLSPSLAYAAGILPSHLVGSLEPVVTRSILAHTNPLAAVGLLAVATRFTQPLSLLTTAFNSAYQPVYYSTRLAEDDANLARLADLARSVWCGALGVALGAALLGPVAIEVMTPPEFHAAGSLVPILALAFLARILYNLVGEEIFFSKRTWLVPVVSLSSATATIVTTALTVERYGARGVAWGLTAGAVAALLSSGYFASRLVRLPHRWAALARMTALAALLAAAGLLLPAPAGLAGRTLVAAALVAAYPLLLLAAGESAIREAVALVRRKLSR